MIKYLTRWAAVLKPLTLAAHFLTILENYHENDEYVEEVRATRK